MTDGGIEYDTTTAAVTFGGLSMTVAEMYVSNPRRRQPTR